MPNKIRLKEIAEAAGVSISTVSLVLNNKSRERAISAEVAKKVKDIADRMGYIPNYSARLMKKNIKQINIGFFSSYETPLIMVNQWLLSVEESLSRFKKPEFDFQLIFEPYHSGKLKDSLQKAQIHAAIITNTLVEDDEFLINSKFPFPIVLIGRDLPGYSAVILDQVDAGKKAASLLVDIGCKQIAVMVPKEKKQVINHRLKGFKDQLSFMGVNNLIEIPYNGLSEKSGFEAVNQYMGQGGDFDGIFALHDILAVGIYHAIFQNGKKIPKDIAVVGFEGISYSSYLNPPLTTFEISYDYYYTEAMNLLLKVIFGETKTEVKKYFRTNLVLRNSTNREMR